MELRKMVTEGDQLRYTGPGDTVTLTVESVDEHNRRIHLEEGNSIHKDALASGNFEEV